MESNGEGESGASGAELPLCSGRRTIPINGEEKARSSVAGRPLSVDDLTHALLVLRAPRPACGFRAGSRPCIVLLGASLRDCSPGWADE
jgi:hypothetical protein